MSEERKKDVLVVKIGATRDNPVPSREHNYMKKVLRMREAGLIIGSQEMQIFHENGCGFLRRGRCDCDPCIVFLSRR
jgi:hypothetical protein